MIKIINAVGKVEFITYFGIKFFVSKLFYFQKTSLPFRKKEPFCLVYFPLNVLAEYLWWFKHLIC